MGEYLGTIIVALILLVRIGLVIRHMVQNVRAGKSFDGGCDGNCAHCKGGHCDR